MSRRADAQSSVLSGEFEAVRCSMSAVIGRAAAMRALPVSYTCASRLRKALDSLPPLGTCS